jgi:phage tail-like protein
VLSVDANGTRFHLLVGPRDWQDGITPEAPGGAPGVEPDRAAPEPGDDPHVVDYDERRVALTLHRRVFQFEQREAEPLPLAARRGAGRDAYGNWYFIGADARSISVVSSGTGKTTRFWPPREVVEAAHPRDAGGFGPRGPAPDRLPARLSGLAVTEHHYLVVGTLDPAGLYVFDLHGGGAPERLEWPREHAFAPFDLVPGRCGGLWVLDRAQRRSWQLDSHLKVMREPPLTAAPEPDDFLNADGSPRAIPRQRLPIVPWPLSAVDPIAIAALEDDTVLVLDRQPDPARPSSALRRYRRGVELGAPQYLDVMRERLPDQDAPLALIAHDMAYLPGTGGAPGTVYVVSSRGLQAYAYGLRLAPDGSFQLEPSPEYLPMRLTGGKALVAAHGHVYYDLGERFVELVEQPRLCFRESAVVHSRVFDGREPGCVWHRLLIDGCVPRSTTLEVWSRAADDAAELAGDRVAWQREPDPVLRKDGSELPFARSLSARPASDTNGTFELLFQRARGRHLQLRLRLTGDGTSTPELRALRAYYPRFSYLEQYLPAIYREEPESASFVERLLALFEGFYTSIEDRIGAAQLLLDVQSAPDDGLDWLASFFGVALDPTWDAARRRLFLRHASELFRARGTVRGLLMGLELAVARCPSPASFQARNGVSRSGLRVVEAFRTRRTPALVLGDPSESGVEILITRERWTPEEGGRALNDAYRQELIRQGITPLPPAFPVSVPLDGSAPLWTAFARALLGFVPSAGPSDAPHWAAFLRAAHGDLARLNLAWGTSYLSFGAVPLFTHLPPDGAQLADWHRFEGVLSVRRAAHRFRVVVPVPAGETGNSLELAERRRLVERILALEKPAHATFDVRFYWAMFRIGEARLGLDTPIHQGSRVPELLGPLVLGQSFLAEGRLAPRPPADAVHRQLLGRDALLS